VSPDFIPVDDNRVGFLVVDISEHGVPAALIATMIKVAIPSSGDEIAGRMQLKKKASSA
jgi:phosphoserine phosphatase RsbU/P